MTTKQSKAKTLKYSHTIGLSTMAGRGFYYPVDTAIDDDGRLYTVSRSLDGDPRGLRVTVYDLDSEYFGTFGSHGEGDGQFIWPTAIARDSQGNTYVADEYTNQINVFDPSWQFASRWGTTGSAPGEMDGPSGLAFDGEENLLVVDHQNNRVQKFTSQGVYLSNFGSEESLNLPWGIAVDGEGNIFVADWGNDRIQKFSPNGELLATYGESGREDGEFFRPAGVAVDKAGCIYVADWGNERVQVLDPEGGFLQKLRGEATDSKWAMAFLDINLEEAAARSRANLSPDIEFFNDDPHEESSHIEGYFWAPTSVKLDREGRIYVTESNRHRVQDYERKYVN